jgi:hypothetical protein
MKTHTHLLTAAMFVSLWLGLAGPASGFYVPTVQRWINRDPIGESGFELARKSIGIAVIYPSPADVFVFNSPISLRDPVGLDINRPPECVEGQQRTRVSVDGCIVRWTCFALIRGLPKWVPIPVPVLGTRVCKVDEKCEAGEWTIVRLYDCSRCTEY